MQGQKETIYYVEKKKTKNVYKSVLRQLCATGLAGVIVVVVVSCSLSSVVFFVVVEIIVGLF